MPLEDDLKETILEWDEDGLRELCNTSMQRKEKSPAELLEIIGDVMRYIGELFEKEEIFLPDLIGSAETVKIVIDEILDPAIRASGVEKKTKGKVVIGTVESDVHSIGKDLVASFLFSNGYEVFNLGVEVPASTFIKKAKIPTKEIKLTSNTLTNV